jgi:hypothetical protein
VRLGDNKFRISALGAPMSPALVHGRRCVEELALPKSVAMGNLSFNKPVIRWMLAQMGDADLGQLSLRFVSPRR